VDQANNIALLELFLALFLGLLFRVNVVSDDAAEGALFEAVAGLLGMFIFVYPVVRCPLNTSANPHPNPNPTLTLTLALALALTLTLTLARASPFCAGGAVHFPRRVAR